MRNTNEWFWYNDISKQIFETCWNYFKCGILAIVLICFTIWIVAALISVLREMFKPSINNNTNVTIE